MPTAKRTQRIPAASAWPAVAHHRVRSLAVIIVMNHFQRLGMRRGQILKGVTSSKSALENADAWIPLPDYYAILANCQKVHPWLTIYDWSDIAASLPDVDAARMLKWMVTMFGAEAVLARFEGSIARINTYQDITTIALSDGFFDIRTDTEPAVVAVSMGIITRWMVGTMAALLKMDGIEAPAVSVLWDQARLCNILEMMHGGAGLEIRRVGDEILANGRSVAERIQIGDGYVNPFDTKRTPRAVDAPFKATLVTSDIVFGGRVLVKQGEIIEAPHSRIQITWPPSSGRHRVASVGSRARLDGRLLKDMEIQIDAFQQRFFESERLRLKERRIRHALKKNLDTLKVRNMELKRARQDISLRERHLQSILESASGFAIYRLSHDPQSPFNLRVTFVSPSIEEISGIAPAAFTAEAFLEIIHPDDIAMVAAANAEAFESNRFEVTCRIHHQKRGDWVWVQGISRGVRNEDGLLTHVNGIFIDVTDKRLAEMALRDREAELQKKARDLEAANAALNAVIRKWRKDRYSAEDKITADLNQLILPNLEKLRTLGHDPSAAALVDIIGDDLKAFSAGFSRRLGAPHIGLTSSELRVAKMIMRGLKSKAIAEQMALSTKTIASHRESIRRKLGLTNKAVNLQAFLSKLK